MKSIYSKSDPSVLLHVLFDLHHAGDHRVDISAATEHLQVSISLLAAGFSPENHSHLTFSSKQFDLPIQESWFIFSGAVLASYFDLDDSLITKEKLSPGTISVSFRGGHGLEVLEDGTIILEHKTGPYRGREFDKRMI
jgi:hypothetical protein